MKLLLDTHLLLWAAGQPNWLSGAARKLIDNPANELLFSAASIWEVVSERGLGRSDFQADPRLLRRGLLDNGYSELPILSDHVSTKIHSTACWWHRQPLRGSLFSQQILWWRSIRAQYGWCKGLREPPEVRVGLSSCRPYCYHR